MDGKICNFLRHQPRARSDFGTMQTTLIKASAVFPSVRYKSGENDIDKGQTHKSVKMTFTSALMTLFTENENDSGGR